MKTGDIVMLRDSSYSMSLVKGVLKHIMRLILENRHYRVLSLSGAYPTDNSHVCGKVESNNTMLIDVNDSNFILFTQEQFLNIVTPVQPALKLSPDQIEITVPRGTKEVRLILQ